MGFATTPVTRMSLIGLGNRSEDVSLVYSISVFYFVALMVCTLTLSLIPVFSLEIWLTRDKNYCDVAVFYFGAEMCQICEKENGFISVAVEPAFGFYFSGGILHGELAHEVVSLLQYFINVLAVYAYSNILDLLWDTENLDQKEVANFKGGKSGRGSIAQSSLQTANSHFDRRERTGRLSAD